MNLAGMMHHETGMMNNWGWGLHWIWMTLILALIVLVIAALVKYLMK